MRKDNLTLFGVTAVGGAFALFLRWLQNGAIFDKETGLAAPNAPISWILALLCIAVALVQLVYCLRLRYRFGDTVIAVPGMASGLLPRLVRIALAALTILGALLMLPLALRSAQPVLMLCFNLLALVYGLLLLWLALKGSGKSAMHALCYALPIIFNCLWLIIIYKDNASNSTLWSFCIEILAVCAAIIAWYFSAGRVFEKPQPIKAQFFCHLAVFLSIMLLADDLPLSTHLLLLGPSLFLLTEGPAKTEE